MFNIDNSFADIKTDNYSGNCIALFTLKQKISGMKDALEMSDNQDRAIKFAHLKVDELKKYKNDKSTTQALIYEMVSDCRSIGINPSKY